MQALEVRLGNYLFKTRSFWPVGLLIIGLLVAYSTGSSSAPKLPSLIFCMSGIFIRFLAVGFSAPNTSGRNTVQGQVADSLNTTGMYACCQHPLYLGNFLIWTGGSLLSGNTWFVLATLVFFLVYYRLIALAEESFLQEKFGPVYESWSMSTSLFVPLFWKWKRPEYPFHWKKVLFQEKSGILNLVITFWLFHLTEQIRFDSFKWADPWNFALLGTFILYAGIKTLGLRSIKPSTAR